MAINIQDFLNNNVHPTKEDVDFNDLIKLFNQFEGSVIDDRLSIKQEFMSFFSEIFTEYFDGFYENILKKGGSDKKKNIAQLFKMLSLVKKHVPLEEFLGFCDIDADNILVLSYQNQEENTKNYIGNIITKLDKWKESGKSLLYSIKQYRQSGEARKDLTSYRPLKLDDDVLEHLLKNIQKAHRSEILVRIEKYIQSGWFDVDKPLEKYFNGEEGLDAAVNSLRSAMGGRFFVANVTQEQIGVHVEHNLELKQDHLLREDVFNIAGSHQKDYAIFSVNKDTLFIGDVTSDESGYGQKTSWTSLGYATKRFQEENPSIKVHVSITLPSLFYDNDFDGEIKQVFIDKLSGLSQDERNEFQYLVVLAALDRDASSYAYNIHEIIKNLNFSFIGASGEEFCNKIIQQEKNDFIEDSLKVIKNILKKMNASQHVFNAQGIDTNIESTCLHLIVAAVKGLSEVVSDDKKNIKKYLVLREDFKSLGKKVVNKGHIKKAINDHCRGMIGEAIFNDYKEGLEEYNQNKSIADEFLKSITDLNENLPKLLPNIQNDVKEIINLVDRNLKPVYSARVSAAHNYRDLFNGVFNSVNNADVKKEGLVFSSSVWHSSPAMNNSGSDNCIKSFYRGLARATTYKNSYSQINTVLKETQKLINNIDNINQPRKIENGDTQSAGIFVSTNVYNGLGYTLLSSYGKFIKSIVPAHEYIHTPSKLQKLGDQKSAEYFDNFKNELQQYTDSLEAGVYEYKSILDAKEKLNASANRQLK